MIYIKYLLRFLMYCFYIPQGFVSLFSIVHCMCIINVFIAGGLLQCSMDIWVAD